ncbi:MAG: CBS domain-containing protein [Candidatus Obscuribacterales bacterium]|nr:CBS domain-containing protein [Candidatus Obscuribacterales bacterium]
MELVLSHRNMDFDCLACQVAVCKLYPAARIVPAHPLSQRIKSFLSLYRDQLPVSDLQYVDWDKVSHVYVVDCQRLDRFDDRARRKFLEYRGPFTIFDHHEIDSESLLPSATSNSVVKHYGAAASVLVEKLRERNVQLTSFEATVIAAGIYEDTGCLTHRGSTEADALGIAYCLSHGADLERINHIIRPKFDEGQVALYEELMNRIETLHLNGARLALCVLESPHYVDGLSEITSRLLENSGADALVSVVKMNDRIHVVSRSESSLFDLRAMARVFGGGGHGGAASAVVKDGFLPEIRQKVVETLAAQMQKEKTARQIMSSPVRTVRQDISMDEAGRIMLRYSQDGLVVMENDQLLGIVSKRDVDKAKHHKLGHAPVRGFMSHPVITVNADCPMSEIQAKMIAEDIGRLPVLDSSGALLGIVGRHELLRALYGDEEDFEMGSRQPANQKIFRETASLIERIEPELLQIYKELGALAAELNMVAYLVGGCVRDLILNRDNFDLDFVVEGSAQALAAALVERMPKKYQLVVEHARFNTATLYVHNSRKREIDIATARTEYYEYPAALPTVEPSSLEQDLYRRDFTINALALSLHPQHFGEIVDYFDGLADMNDGIVRVLHPFSFIEDPTRIIRAARFAARLNFQLDPRSKLQAERAIALGIFDNLGGVRLKSELRLILESAQRLRALDLLAELGGGLRFLESTIRYEKRTRLQLRRAGKLLQNYELQNHFAVYLGVLLYQLTEDRLKEALERLHLAESEVSWILDAHVLLRGLLELDSCAKHSDIYRVLHKHDEHSLAIAVCVAPPASHLRRSIRLYFENLRGLKPSISGHELLALGIKQGPFIGRILQELHDAILDGEISSIEDEKAFVLQNYSELIQSNA